jgi:hypothetical protein
MRILATISSSAYLIENKRQDQYLKEHFPKYNDYFTKFMTELLDLFRKDTGLRYDKGSVIIKLEFNKIIMLFKIINLKSWLFCLFKKGVVRSVESRGHLPNALKHSHQREW